MTDKLLLSAAMLREPLVMLPGMMCDARLFGPQIAAFSNDTALHIAPITVGTSIQAIAQTVLEGAPKRFALLGLSMGGIVAMEIVRRAPERVTRLVLMDTNPLAETPAYAATRDPQIARVKSGKLTEVMRDMMKPSYLAPGPNRAAVLELVMSMAQNLGPEVFVRQSRALQRRPDQQSVLRKLKIPTLVMCGEHDELCPVKRHEFMADLIPKATLKIIKDAGHLPTLERPNETADTLRDWLAG